jgi:hypothetical protein
MFALAYLIAIVIAGLPLAITLLQGRDGAAIPLPRICRDLLYLVCVIIGIVITEVIFRISLQNYWFGELGQQYRYWLALGLRTGIFAAIFAAVGLFAGINLRALLRPLPVIPRSAPWLLGFVFSAIVAFGATDLWTPLMGPARLTGHSRQPSRPTA